MNLYLFFFGSEYYNDIIWICIWMDEFKPLDSRIRRKISISSRKNGSERKILGHIIVCHIWCSGDPYLLCYCRYRRAKDAIVVGGCAKCCEYNHFYGILFDSIQSESKYCGFGHLKFLCLR